MRAGHTRPVPRSTGDPLRCRENPAAVRTLTRTGPDPGGLQRGVPRSRAVSGTLRAGLKQAETAVSAGDL